MSTSGPQLTRYPSNLTYAQLDQRAKASYLHCRTQALRAEQAAVAINALTPRFSVDVYLGLKPKPQPSAAVARACAHLLRCVQRLPPFDDLRKLYLSRDGRDLTDSTFRCVAKINREAHESKLRVVVASAAAAASEGQLRRARSAPAVFVSAPTPRHHCYLMRHYTGLFDGAETDPAVYFSQDHQAQRLAERQRRARADLQRHALAARQAQPRQYRRHPAAHARTWQPNSRSAQHYVGKPARSSESAHEPVQVLPDLKPAPLPDPTAEATGITAHQVGTADHTNSDAASAASTVNLVAALMTLVRFVRSTLAPPGRRRYTKETQRASLSAATDRWPQTAPTLGRWICVPRDCRKARSSLSLHRDCTDGTGTRPSFEPR